MSPHDRLDLARVLLAKAVDDETLVRKVCSDTDVADAIIGFHAQQATEKLIKAVLAARGVTFVKSHALSYLVGLVEENDIAAPDELSEADVLSPWAVEFRYEGESRPPWTGLRPSSWSNNSERGPKARLRPQASRKILPNESWTRANPSRAAPPRSRAAPPGITSRESVRTTASYRRKTGMAGRFSKSPWPLIRRLYDDRFGT